MDGLTTAPGSRLHCSRASAYRSGVARQTADEAMLLDPMVFFGVVPRRALLALVLAAPFALALALVPIVVALAAARAAACTSPGQCSLPVAQPLIRLRRIKGLAKTTLRADRFFNGAAALRPSRRPVYDRVRQKVGVITANILLGPRISICSATVAPRATGRRGWRSRSSPISPSNAGRAARSTFSQAA